MTANQAYRRTEVLYRPGAKDYLSVLNSQHNKMAIEDERAQAETAFHISIVSLLRLRRRLDKLTSAVVRN
ncbi:MAG: hypothetical protein ACXV8Q_08740 [Methylobacter sp.]